MTRPKMIAVCTPSLGSVSLEWTRIVAELMWPMNVGRAHQFVRDAVGGEIAETRNAIVQKCLDMEKQNVEIDSLFWLDDDVLPTRAALIQLYSHHRDIASGAYFTKGEPGQPLVFPGRLQGTAPWEPDRVLEAWGHGMGLCLVKASVYKRMLAEGLSKDKYGRPQWYKTPQEYRLEGQMLDCGGTEDLYFLDAANQFGYKPLVDCGKWTFGFHYDRESHRGYPEKQFEQLRTGQPVTWETPSGTVTWK